MRVIKLTATLKDKGAPQLIANQVFRSGTSVGAHCAEASHAKSRADFLNKIVGATQELEETLYWFDILVDSGIVKESRLIQLRTEAKELMAILVTIAKKTKAGGLK